MSHPALNKLSSQILDEAAHWFVEFSEGTVTLRQRKQYIDWLRTSPEHIRAYLQITAHWEDARSLTVRSALSIDELVALACDETAAIVLLEPSEKPQTDDADHLEIGVLAPMRGGDAKAIRRFAWAASIVLIALAAGYWFNIQRSTFSTDAAEQRTITLSDGSTVQLNVKSRIRVVFSADERDLYMTRGQALFRIAKDSRRPFVVHTDDTTVRAVGTEFDVYRKETGTTVTVLEGTVAIVPAPKGVETMIELPQAGSKLSNSREAVYVPKTSVAQRAKPLARNPSALLDGDATVVVLTAGNQTTVTTQGDVTPLHEADGAAAIAWTHQQLVLHNTPLAEVVAEFNRYNSRPLVIVDAAIRSTRMSGIFSSANPDSLLRGLEALGFKVRELKDRVEIYSP